MGYELFSDILRTLDQHSIERKYVDGVLMVKDEYTINGKYGFEWIICPKTNRGVFAWLGY